MIYSDFKDVLSEAIQEIKEKFTFNCYISTLSENDEKYKTSLDVGCVLQDDEVSNSLFFFSRLSNCVLRLASERNLSKDNQINIALILNDFYNIKANGYLYFYWNKNMILDGSDGHQELPLTIKESTESDSPDNNSININLLNEDDEPYLSSVTFYKEVFLRRANYLLDNLKIYSSKLDNTTIFDDGLNQRICKNLITELENIPLSTDSIKLINSLKTLIQCDVIPPKGLIDNIKNIIKIGNIANNSNCIYTLLK